MGVIEVVPYIPATAYWLAERWIGTKELPGGKDNPFVLGMLQLDQSWPSHDEVPWCSAFANFICWQLRLPRSKDLRARSWLDIGRAIKLAEARVGFDILVLNRGGNPQPIFDPQKQKDPAHVTFYGGVDDHGQVLGLGGNQGNMVRVSPQNISELLSVRRLKEAA